MGLFGGSGVYLRGSQAGGLALTFVAAYWFSDWRQETAYGASGRSEGQSQRAAGALGLAAGSDGHLGRCTRRLDALGRDGLGGFGSLLTFGAAGGFSTVCHVGGRARHARRSVTVETR